MIGRPSPCSTGSSARSAVFTASASTPSLPASITNAMARHSRSNSGGGDCGDGGRTARGQRGSGIDRCQKWPAPRGEGGGGRRARRATAGGRTTGVPSSGASPSASGGSAIVVRARRRRCAGVDVARATTTRRVVSPTEG
eukprot:30891-Pelagococcus_subviridis.AAC.5